MCHQFIVLQDFINCASATGEIDIISIMNRNNSISFGEFAGYSDVTRDIGIVMSGIDENEPHRPVHPFSTCFAESLALATDI